VSDAQHPSRRRWALQMQQPLPSSTVFDRIAFLIGTASAVWLAVIISMQGFRYPWSCCCSSRCGRSWPTSCCRACTGCSATSTCPTTSSAHAHGDGLLGDPVNLGVDGTAAQLDDVMRAGLASRRRDHGRLDLGDHRLDPHPAQLSDGARVAAHAVRPPPRRRISRRSRATPSSATTCGSGTARRVAAARRREDRLARRRHVRHRRGLSLFTLQVTHRIDENTDIERDFVVQSAREADPAVGARCATSPPATTPATAAATGSSPTATCRSST
jgi:hypothetical protein